MATVVELLGDVPALRGLSARQRETLAACAAERDFMPDELLLREGEEAASFFVIRDGLVALEMLVPGRGPVTVETLGAGDLLGWSWIVPPYRTAFSARALGSTQVVALDGPCLRGLFEREPALGYEVLKILAGVFAARLRDTRVRLLDLYGPPGDD